MLAGKIGLIILLCVAVPHVMAENCDANVVLERLKPCAAIGISPNSTAAIVNSICQNVECTIRCVTDALGTCNRPSPVMPFFDPEVIKVSYRLMCNNSQAMLDMLTHCVKELFIDNACFKTLTGAMATSNQNFTSGNYASYKAASCSATNTYVACIGNNPIVPSGNCTSDMAALATEFSVFSNSYSECGNAQTHQYFTTYAGDVTCVACRFSMTIAYVISALVLLF
ncbi:uncharacterized protein LOC127863828 [Dreissena polymorpha]|uniref:uncharacterized protein LOC127863828 n=1 Tax=Dreissena polymorpha TaxID=45954 RepID=UPI002264A12A|nr:uncharacterized protein LOC127863828 [Dreissena polymorpha]